LNSFSNCVTIADVIDALVEAAGELRRDRLDRDALIGDGGEDDEQLRRRLRAVGFIHGNLGDEVVGARPWRRRCADRSRGLLGGFEELVGGFLDIRAGDLKRLGDALDGDRADQFRVFVDERGDVRRIGGLADVVGDVEREEIAGRDEAVHGGEVDVVGIQQVFAGPAEVGDRLVGGLAGLGGLGADDVVLAVGLVPDRGDVDAEFLGFDEGGELGVRAIGETIADAEGVFRAGFHSDGSVDFDDGFDRAECGIGEFFKLGWNLGEGDAVGDPEVGVDFPLEGDADQSG
jgi:hypothetical protein